MKIWIVSEGEPLPIDDENVRLRRMGQLAEILWKRGHEVHWFSSTYHHYKKSERYKDDTEINYKHNYIFHLLKGKKYKKNVSIDRILHHKKIAQKFKKLSIKIKQPDIILATMAPLELSDVAVEYANNKNIPIIIDVRDLWPEMYLEVVPKWSKKIIEPYVNIMKKKLSLLIQKSNGLIAVTDGFLDYGLNIAGIHKRPNDKVFHTSYTKVKNANEDLKSNWGKYNLDRNDFIVSFMGNFGKQFELEAIFKAAEKLEIYKNIKFVLCGSGENLEDYKKKYSEHTNIIMPGWIEGEQIQTLLSNTQIGIAPYRDSVNFRKNVPNKFGEYLSYDLPIFVSVTGDMEGLLNEFNCGYYYNSAEDLANKIIKLYEDRQLQLDMTKNASELFDKKFNARNVYKDLADYLEIIAK